MLDVFEEFWIPAFAGMTDFFHERGVFQQPGKTCPPFNFMIRLTWIESGRPEG